MLVRPADAWLLYVLAHGAGAGMRHPFLEAAAQALARRGVATYRYEFPYMAAGRARPDPPDVAHRAVRAAVARAARTGLPLVAGGKSFGGRMTSQAQAAKPLAGVRGLVFLGFPLHPPEKPGTQRADHLAGVRVPMLFLSGTRDELAELALLRPVVARLPQATLRLEEDADHAFHVRKRSGRDDAQVIESLADAIVDWARATVPA